MTTDLLEEADVKAPAPVHALEVRGLVKHYPGVKALDGVDLVVRQHEVLGLAGENGAGKSTLLKALVGLVRPDAGEIWVRGEKVRIKSVVDAAEHGIGMVFQEQSLVPNLTAAENIVLGSEGRGVRRGVYRWDAMRRLAQEQLDKIGSHIDPLARTDTLTFADRQMVEIAKVLRIEERTSHPPVIILDEPTSVLESKEIETLFTQVRRLREFASVIFVSHRLDEVLDVCDRVSVLRGGQSVGEVPAAGAAPGDLHRMMIGSTGSEDHYHDTTAQQSEKTLRPMLQVRGLSGLRSATSTSTSTPARSSPSWASTARGARTSAGRCSVPSPRRPGRSPSTARSSTCPAPAPPARPASGTYRRSARSRAWSGRCRSPTT